MGQLGVGSDLAWYDRAGGTLGGPEWPHPPPPSRPRLGWLCQLQFPFCWVSSLGRQGEACLCDVEEFLGAREAKLWSTHTFHTLGCITTHTSVPLLRKSHGPAGAPASQGTRVYASTLPQMVGAANSHCREVFTQGWGTIVAVFGKVHPSKEQQALPPARNSAHVLAVLWPCGWSEAVPLSPCTNGVSLYPVIQLCWNSITDKQGVSSNCPGQRGREKVLMICILVESFSMWSKSEKVWCRAGTPSSSWWRGFPEHRTNDVKVSDASRFGKVASFCWGSRHHPEFRWVWREGHQNVFEYF